MSDIDYKELERLYNDAAKRKSYCAHKRSKTSVDENGVYHFDCPDCGLHGMSDLTGAIKLGWFLP